MHIDRNAMITVTVQRVQIEDIIKNILHLFLIKHETLFVQSEWLSTDFLYATHKILFSSQLIKMMAIKLNFNELY